MRLSSKVCYIPVEQIRPNPQQPRREFRDEELRELADSIAVYGILQPLTVRKCDRTYELIAGERRLRAARAAGLAKVPCLVAAVDDADAGMLALLENVQRQDLNCFEEAAAIAALIRNYGLSQEQVAEKLGRSQSAVANKLRLLRLGDEVRANIIRGGLTERHGRALLRLATDAQRLQVLEQVLAKDMTVAQTEALVERTLQTIRTTPPRRAYVIKDVRIFLNTIAHSLDIMQKAGVPAAMERTDGEEAITLTIHIPTKCK